jgi:hypothetical protein
MAIRRFVWRPRKPGPPERKHHGASRRCRTLGQSQLLLFELSAEIRANSGRRGNTGETDVAAEKIPGIGFR